jgi:SAM-dependent methyltransferase
MKSVDFLHGIYVHSQRVRVLGDQLVGLIRANESLLDIGTGDGLLAALIQEKRPDVTVAAIDVAARRDAHISVQLFDGRNIRYSDRTFDVAMLVDVLHHTQDPMILLHEAVRVSRHAVLLKDHTLTGFAAGLTLRLMDSVGNRRHDVALPYNYWPRTQWLEAARALGLSITSWNSNLGLYPWPANIIFERSLHFVARLELPAMPAEHV